jgi:hypothetical protein
MHREQEQNTKDLARSELNPFGLMRVSKLNRKKAPPMSPGKTLVARLLLTVLLTLAGCTSTIELRNAATEASELIKAKNNPRNVDISVGAAPDTSTMSIRVEMRRATDRSADAVKEIVTSVYSTLAMYYNPNLSKFAYIDVYVSGSRANPRKDWSVPGVIYPNSPKFIPGFACYNCEQLIEYSLRSRLLKTFSNTAMTYQDIIRNDVWEGRNAVR